MARPQQTEARTLDSLSFESHLPHVVAAAKPAAEKQVSRIEWELNRKLQTSLDISTIIRIFVEELQSEFRFQQSRYENPEAGIELVIGKEKAGRHSCNYTLTVADGSLGRLSFTRNQRFSERDLNRVEELLCLLVYPLRNALLYKEALDQAMKDSLTGALNRAALDTMLEKELDSARRHGTPLSLLMIDVDHFKDINDKHGHSTGDQVLRTLVSRIDNEIRRSDILFRYGGEEFTLVLNNTQIEGAKLLAERIRQAIDGMTYIHGDTALRFTISIGIACFDGEESMTGFLDRADQALYVAKHLGRNCVALS